jgi:hypothetical protein
MSNAYGGILAHARRMAQWYDHNANRVHLDITVANHHKKEDWVQYNQNMNRVSNPNLTSVNLSLAQGEWWWVNDLEVGDLGDDRWNSSPPSDLFFLSSQMVFGGYVSLLDMIPSRKVFVLIWWKRWHMVRAGRTGKLRPYGWSLMLLEALNQKVFN